MGKVKNTVLDEDILWEMDWSQTDKQGNRRYPEKPEKEMIFEEEPALALMLINRVFHLNDHWWEDQWPEEARKTISFNVDCSDVFAWGCSDSEDLPYNKIRNLYDFWKKDPVWGPSVWCMIRRKQMPQAPVEEKIRKAGIWDLEELCREHEIRTNAYDGIFGVIATLKYETYSAWELSRGNQPMPFDEKWHSGWKLYAEEHPQYYDDAWQAEESRRIEEWKKANGHDKDETQ